MSNNRSRGHNFEREIMKQLREIGYDKVKSTRDASTYADSLKIDIIGCDPYVWQCKRKRQGYASTNELLKVDYNSWREFINCKELIPVLVSRPDQGESVVSLYLKDFLPLICPQKQ